MSILYCKALLFILWSRKIRFTAVFYYITNAPYTAKTTMEQSSLLGHFSH